MINIAAAGAVHWEFVCVESNDEDSQSFAGNGPGSNALRGRTWKNFFEDEAWKRHFVKQGPSSDTLRGRAPEATLCKEGARMRHFVRKRSGRSTDAKKE